MIVNQHQLLIEKNPLSAENHDEIKDMSENDDEMMETSDTNEGETTSKSYEINIINEE